MRIAIDQARLLLETVMHKLGHSPQESVIIEMTGDDGKVSAFLKLVEPFGILELARTGVLAQMR